MNMDMNMENMGTLGAYLKKTREQSGISIEELSSATKINISVLVSLETDDFKKLPAPIFVKGFIRSYLKYLGVDSKEAILFYELLTSPTRKPDAVIDNISDREGVKINKYKVKMSIRLIITALSVVVLVLSLVVYNMYSKIGKKKNDLSEDKMIVKMSEPQPVVSNANVNSNTNATTNSNTNMNANANVNINTNTNSNTNSNDNKRSNKNTNTNTNSNNNVAVAAPVAVQKQLIVIKAQADLWVKVKIDDAKPFDFLLRAGGTKKLEGNKEIKVLLGDAASATIDYNGETLKNLGAKGFMKSVVFPGLGKWQDALVR